MDRALVQARAPARATRAARGGRGRAVRRRHRTRAAAADRTVRRTAVRPMAAAAIATGTEPRAAARAESRVGGCLEQISVRVLVKVVDIAGGIGIYVFLMTLADLCLFCLSFFVRSFAFSRVCRLFFVAIDSTPCVCAEGGVRLARLI